MPATGKIATGILVAVIALPAFGRAASTHLPAESPRALVRDVIYNELHDRERDSHWEYLSHRITSDQNVVREQIETTKGPVFRILERNGAPLSAAQQKQEDLRLAAYIHDPSAVSRILQDHLADESRLANIMRLLPQAFTYRYDGPPSGDIVRLSFKPDPSYTPSTYEARIVHALAGTFTVNLRYRRMVEMRGVLIQRVDFGFGILGHVDQGGTFEIHRLQVSPRHWKTDLVDVHVQGRILMLKTVSKDEREVRSDFRPVPLNLSLAEAKNMLLDINSQDVQAQLASDSGTPAPLHTAR